MGRPGILLMINFGLKTPQHFCKPSLDCMELCHCPPTFLPSSFITNQDSIMFWCFSQPSLALYISLTVISPNKNFTFNSILESALWRSWTNTSQFYGHLYNVEWKPRAPFLIHSSLVWFWKSLPIKITCMTFRRQDGGEVTILWRSLHSNALTLWTSLWIISTTVNWEHADVFPRNLKFPMLHHSTFEKKKKKNPL